MILMIALLPADWNPREQADRVLAGLKNICAPQVKGAHDSDFLIADGKAYVVYMANDVQHGEAADWPFVYCAMTIVDLASNEISPAVTFAAGEKEFDNHCLPVGACFVPRIIQKDNRTLRCFFASEQPRVRQAQTWWIDFDLPTQTFARTIHPVSIRTAQGQFPMQPQPFFRDAVARGFTGKESDYGLYMIDGFKTFNGQIYCVLNNFIIRQNALATLNADMDCIQVLGHFFEPNSAKLSESAVQQMPDGSWCAISRQETADQNYLFATSADGVSWTPHHTRDCVKTGSNSKATFDRFNNLYYLGWQDSARIDGVYRTIFSVDISANGKDWQRKYRFETNKSFQYPVFRQHAGAVFLSVTQGDYTSSRKERIMFGRLE